MSVNVSQFLEKYGLKLISNDVIVSFKCKNEHVNKLSLFSFKSKCLKSEKETDIHSYMCSVCWSEKQEDLIIESILKEISHVKHKVLLVVDNKHIKIECWNCHKESTVSKRDLLQLKTCKHCYREACRTDVEDVKSKLLEHGLELVKYNGTNNIDCRCICGRVYNTCISGINRGRLCASCAKDRREKTNLKKYNVKNPFQAADFQEKRKTTCLEKYGKEHHLQNLDILEKVKLTNLQKLGVKFSFLTQKSLDNQRSIIFKKFGVRFPLQSKLVMNKVKKTNMIKYGCNYPLESKYIREKIVNTWMNKYGVHTPFAVKSIREKIYKTWMEKYGGNPMFDPDVVSKMLKNSFAKKDYVFPSGKIVSVMGYEPRCIDELLKRYDENDIITETKKIPVIKYNKHCKKYGKRYFRKGRYFPDILLPDKLIEVKSVYTYNLDSINNELKMRAAVASGYNIELWIFNRKKLVSITSYTKDNTLKFDYRDYVEE